MAHDGQTVALAVVVDTVDLLGFDGRPPPPAAREVDRGEVVLSLDEPREAVVDGVVEHVVVGDQIVGPGEENRPALVLRPGRRLLSGGYSPEVGRLEGVHRLLENVSTDRPERPVGPDTEVTAVVGVVVAPVADVLLAVVAPYLAVGGVVDDATATHAGFPPPVVWPLVDLLEVDRHLLVGVHPCPEHHPVAGVLLGFEMGVGPRRIGNPVRLEIVVDGNPPGVAVGVRVCP
ncbi:MAG: hypothetical protein ABEL76_17130, partial [Bradymonadaceae bacterium]